MDCTYLDHAEHIWYPAGPQHLHRFSGTADLATWDIEDIVKEGHSTHTCPYHASRDLLAEGAGLVLCTYSQLFDPPVRSANGLDELLEGAVVVVDEAHNLMTEGRQCASLEMSEAELLSLMRDVRQMREVLSAKPEKELQVRLLLWLRPGERTVGQTLGTREGCFFGTRPPCSGVKPSGPGRPLKRAGGGTGGWKANSVAVLAVAKQLESIGARTRSIGAELYQRVPKRQPQTRGASVAGLSPGGKRRPEGVTFNVSLYSRPQGGPCRSLGQQWPNMTESRGPFTSDSAVNHSSMPRSSGLHGTEYMNAACGSASSL